MDPEPEGEVPADLPAHVEAVALGEVPLVPVGRAVQQDHDAALGDLLTVVLHVAAT